MLLGSKATLPKEQEEKVDHFITEIERIAQSAEGTLAIAIVGAKLASES